MATQAIGLPYPVPLSSCFINKGKGRTKSPRYRAYEEEAGKMLNAQGARPMKPPYHVTITLCAPDKRKRDADNLFKCLFDTLVKNGIIEDDNNQCIHSGSWAWTEEGEPCTVHITSI